MADTDMPITDELGDVAHLLQAAEEVATLLEDELVGGVMAGPDVRATALTKVRLVAARVRGRLPEGGR